MNSCNESSGSRAEAEGYRCWELMEALIKSSALAGCEEQLKPGAEAVTGTQGQRSGWHMTGCEL